MPIGDFSRENKKHGLYRKDAIRTKTVTNRMDVTKKLQNMVIYMYNEQDYKELNASQTQG